MKSFRIENTIFLTWCSIILALTHRVDAFTTKHPIAFEASTFTTTTAIYSSPPRQPRRMLKKVSQERVDAATTVFPLKLVILNKIYAIAFCVSYVEKETSTERQQSDGSWSI